MEKIKLEEEKQNGNDSSRLTARAGHSTSDVGMTSSIGSHTGDGLPLPCHYFDFIVGTSTGG